MKLLLVGSITNSVAHYKDGDHKIFGGAMFGGRVAAALGIDTTILTPGANDIEPGIEQLKILGLNVVRIPRETSNCFANDYSVEPRKMFAKSIVGKPIDPSEINLNINQYDGVILAPLYREVTPEILSLFSDKQMVMLDAQGLTRQLGEKNENGLYPISIGGYKNIADFAGRVDILKLSHEDLAGIEFQNEMTDEDKCNALVKVGFNTVVLTNAEKPTLLFQKDKSVERVLTFNIEAKDTNGAGDVFTVAFMHEYGKMNDASKSARFANAAAAVKVSGEKLNMESVSEMLSSQE